MAYNRIRFLLTFHTMSGIIWIAMQCIVLASTLRFLRLVLLLFLYVRCIDFEMTVKDGNGGSKMVAAIPITNSVSRASQILFCTSICSTPYPGIVPWSHIVVANVNGTLSRYCLLADNGVVPNPVFVPVTVQTPAHAGTTFVLLYSIATACSSIASRSVTLCTGGPIPMVVPNSDNVLLRVVCVILSLMARGEIMLCASVR